ncbi:MAG: formylglycine-generating enzyme family protein [Planctomycetia bacterium]|nr:formylglycine-generating enzyme family protein [Planctomycetia bacterium]
MLWDNTKVMYYNARTIILALVLGAVLASGVAGQQEWGMGPHEIPPEMLERLPPDVLDRLFLERSGRGALLRLAGPADGIYSVRGVKETDDCLFLASGDRVSGRVSGISADGFISLVNPLFANVLKVRVGDVRRMIPARKDKVVDGPDTVILAGGKKIRGSVQSITAESLVLKTLSMGTVKVKRSVVAAVDLQADSNVVLQSKFSAGSSEPWKVGGGSWAIKDGAYRCTTPLSWASAPVEQHGPMTIEWTVAGLTPRATGGIMFFVENDKGVWGGNGIYIQPRSNRIRVYQIRNDRTPLIMRRFFGRAFTRATFRAAYDPGSGELGLWVNDMALGRCKLEPVVTKGKFVKLYSRNPYSIYEKVRVFRGALGVSTRVKAEETEDQLILANTDKLTGTFVAFKGADITIRTPYGELKIPRRNVQRIVFCRKGLARPRKRAEDSSALLHGGTTLALKIKAMDAENLIADTAVLGNVRISRKALRSITFARSNVVLDLGGGVSMRFIEVSAGRFIMGGTGIARTLYGRPPAGMSITISRPFMMGVTEVTRAQFAAFVKATAHKTVAEIDGWSTLWEAEGVTEDKGVNWRQPKFKQNDDHPVVCVTWDDATAFCKWMSKKTGRKVRLPTEAEWQYACRAGTVTRYSTGNNITTDQANYDGTAAGGVFRKGTVAVASFDPNVWGLHDMHGNVAEWCNDWLGALGAPSGIDPTGPATGQQRVIRDGAWYYKPDTLRTGLRTGVAQNYRNYGLGFRVVVESK